MKNIYFGKQMKTNQITAALLATTFFLISPLTVQASDFQGSLDSVSINDAATSNQPPVAKFSFSKTGDTYTFDARESFDSDGSIVGYKWTVDDGTTGAATTLSYQVATGSTTPFTVTLAVMDNNNAVTISQQTITPSTGPFEVIIDDADPEFSVVGAWRNSNAISGYYGTGYHVAARGDGSSVATWQATLPVTGTYQVYCQYPAYSNRASNAPYSIEQDSTVIANIAVNQKTNGSSFFLIGDYQLSAGIVKINLSNNADNYVIADAIKIVLIQ